jgi:hypothetical protein
MYFLSELQFEVPVSKWVKGMAFVEHPGYFRPALTEVSRRAFASRIRSLLIGGFGDWETSKMSSAFTPRNLREKYVCGGAWFGLKKDFLELCVKARDNVNVDKQNNVVAKWHDESHLNQLVSLQKNPTIFSSRYCYEPQYGKVLKDPILLAINKSTSLEEQLQSMDVQSK